MLFNSFIFLVFLCVVLTTYYLARTRVLQNRFLLVASYFFYGWWDYRFLTLLLFSTTVDYFVARAIPRSENPERKKLLLSLSLTSNLGCLGFFKYFGFFIDSAEQALGAIGFGADFPTLHIILPVGISFYTFQTLSYTIDVYRGQLKPTDNFLDLALYVSFFPQLVAGPIERATHFLPQILSPRKFDIDQIVGGIFLIVIGFFKKLVIADRMSKIVDPAFSGIALPDDGISNWLFIYAFAFQVYGDFSGYSDIARGTAKLMGFELSINFKAPYLSSNPSEFWRHWHISLSTWLRDYLYIPLGGNKGSGVATHRNLMLTMLLGGLWHGAGWAFVLWGAYQGTLLSGHRLIKSSTSKLPIRTQKPRTFLSGRPLAFGKTFLFFHLCCLGWLLFRIGGVPYELQMNFLLASIQSLWILDFPSTGIDVLRWVAPIGVAVFVLQFYHEELEQAYKWHSSTQALVMSACCAGIAIFGVLSGTQFIYFAF